MISSATRIASQEPAVDAADLIAELRAINEYGRVSNVLRSMSIQPSFLRAMWQSFQGRSNGGRLTPAQHNLIAAYVATQTHRENSEAPGVELASANPEERLLLEFVGELIQQPYLIPQEQIRRLQEASWTDTQIAQAVYDANLFNLMARIDEACPQRASTAPEREPVFAA